MKKDRLVQLRKKLEEKHRQLEEEVGRNVLYGKGPEDDSIKDLGDQASSAYNREFLFELGNGERRRLKEVALALQKITEGGFGDCERCGEADRRQASGRGAGRALLHRVPARDRRGRAYRGPLARPLRSVVSIRFGLVVGLLFAIVVTYLTSINPSRVHVALGGDWAFDIPLMALIAVVFGAGAGSGPAARHPARRHPLLRAAPRADRERPAPGTGRSRPRAGGFA